jgi:hypothetical protein
LLGAVGSCPAWLLLLLELWAPASTCTAWLLLLLLPPPRHQLALLLLSVE